MEEYRIGELAEKSGVSRRTIHYYLSRGLLPPSEGAGLGTTYSEEHYFRILLIKQMQDHFFPLDEIKKRITSMSLEQVRDALSLGEQKNVKVTEEKNQYGFYESFSMHNKVEEGKEPLPGQAYQRVVLAHGVEIHFPLDQQKASQLAQKLLQFAEKELKEG